MKKIFSLILVLCMVLSFVVIPVNADNGEIYTGDTYYKFTFGENGTSYMDYASGSSATHKNNTYYPLWETTKGYTTLNGGSIKDSATGNTIDVMTVTSQGTTSWQWTPLKEDGTPFEAAPNASYTVKMKFYVESLKSYGQLHAAIGASNTPIPYADMDWQKGLFTTSGSYQGVLNDRQSIKFLFQSSSMLYAGTSNKVYNSFDSTNTAQYFNGDRKIVTDNNGVYDNANNTYTFTVDVWNSVQNPSTSAWENNQQIDTRIYNNYFTISGDGGTFTENGVTYNNVWHIEEIEIALNPPTVTFVNGKTTTTASFTPGEEIKYPNLTPNHKGDYVWSLSKEEYIPAPEKMTAGALTVYAFQRDIFGFENHKQYDYSSISSRVKITDEFAFSGNKSVRYRNVEYGLSESEPFNWATGYTAYYTYDSATNTYTAVTGSSAPVWQENTYYMKRNYSELEHNIDLWALEANKSYRITFRYYFDKSSGCGFKIIPMTSYTNFWAADNRVTYDTQSVAFDNDLEENWRVGEIYLQTGNIVSGYGNLFLRIVNTADNNTTPCTVYFDEFRIEEKAKTELINPVSSAVYYAGFENYPAEPQAIYCLMQDTGATVEEGKTYKNNMSVISGDSVFSDYADGNIVKYDHVKGSYCSNHKSNLSYSYAQYNAIYPNINININNGSSYKVTFSYKAEKVDTPVQMGWFMAAFSNQWTGGSVKDTLGYTISAPTNDWVTVSYIIKFPDSYTMNQNNECKLAHLWMYMEKDADVLIYFDNYYVQEVPTVAFVDEYGNKTYVSGEEENKVKFPETQGSHDVYAEDGTGNTVSGSNWYLDEKYLNVVDADNVYFTKERLTVYYQKYDKSVEYGSDQQSYCGFENSSVVPADGYIDATNKYIISRYDKGYTENGVFTQDEWSLAGYNGFESGNFKIADIGYMSERSLAFEQTSAEVNKKIADISNGVLLEDKTSYRVSFFYRVDGESDEDLTFTFTNAKNTKEYGEGETITVSADKVSGDWTLITIDLTTDFENGNYCIPAIIVNKDINDTARTVYIDSVAVCKAVETAGISVLKDDVAATAGSQAMRFYFSYNADQNGKMLFAGNECTVAARGILVYDRAKEQNLTRENGNVIKVEKTENLDHCWNYANGVLTFSAYITNFDLTDTRSIKVRGYVVLNDGSVLYSQISTYCVDDVIKYNNLEEGRKDYSLNDSSVMDKVRLMGANEKVTNGYTFDWNGSALVLNAKAVGDITVYLEAGTNLEIHKFTLYIDGKCVTDQLKPELVSKGKYKVTFNVGDYPTIKDIRFIRQQEACIGGAAVITGFNMAGELYKSEEAELLIEYLGDSITSGIGVHRTPDGWASDGTNSYAFLSAMNMGVDWRIRSRSGIGAYKNSGGAMGLNSDWLNSYHIENGWRSSTTPYSESRQADVVVLYLGTNDNWGYKTIDTEAEIAELAGGMKQLIDKVKSYNPNAKIVWVSGGMTDKYRESARRAIEQSGGESAGYFLCDVPLNMSAGQNGHPDAKQQRIIARSLQTFLETNVLTQ